MIFEDFFFFLQFRQFLIFSILCSAVLADTMEEIEVEIEDSKNEELKPEYRVFFIQATSTSYSTVGTSTLSTWP